jgi:hypothetical protein
MTVNVGIKRPCCGKETSMDRLSITAIFMSTSVPVGSGMIAVLSLGPDDWRPTFAAVAVGVAVGVVLTWPAALAVSRWIKGEDRGLHLCRAAAGGKDQRQADFPET